MSGRDPSAYTFWLAGNGWLAISDRSAMAMALSLRLALVRGRFPRTKKTAPGRKAGLCGQDPSAAFPTLVFRSAVPDGTRAAFRDQVRGVGGLDPASQLLAPPAG